MYLIIRFLFLLYDIHMELKILEPFFNRKGFSIVEETLFKCVFTKNGLYLIVIDQRFDGLEVYIGNQPDKGEARIGFLLEYFLSNDVKLSRALASQLKSASNQDEKNQIIEKYTVDFINNYSGSVFREFEEILSEYPTWSKGLGMDKINEIRALLQ